jgi:hypothetical protein
MALALNLIIIVLALVTLVYLLKGGPKAPQWQPKGKPAGGSYTPLPEGEPAHDWSDGGRFQLEVVGESRYQGTIRELAGEHGDANASAVHPALLLPDDHNPYEDKAVAVFLSGEMVGYLNPKDALAFRARLDRLGLEGKLTSSQGIVRGGGLFEGKRLSYSVSLDIEVHA